MKHLHRWWWLIFAVGVALRLFNLGTRPLWYDEAGTAWMAALPFDRMLAATAADTHPPLYLALEWLTVGQFGASAAALRFPSALASIGSLWLAWRLAQRLKLPPAASLAGAALTAIAPYQIHFAQEARMYALVQCLFLVGVLAALNRRWYLYGPALAGLLWTHNYGWLYSLPMNVIYVLQIVRAGGWRRRNWQLWTGIGLANAGAVASWLPWLPTLLSQVQAVGSGYWIERLTLGGWLFPWYQQWWGFSVPDWLQAHVGLLAFGLTAFALVKAVMRRNRAALVLGFLALATPAAAGAVSMAWTPIYLARALIGSSVPTYFLVGWALTEGVGRLGRGLAVALLGPALVLVLNSYYFGYSAKVDDSPKYVAYVLSHWQPGDLIFHANDNSLLTFYPLLGPASPSALLPLAAHERAGLSEPTRRAMGIRVAGLDELDWGRAWFVWASAPTTTAAQDAQAQAVLDTHPHRQIMLTDNGMVRVGLWLVYPGKEILHASK